MYTQHDDALPTRSIRETAKHEVKRLWSPLGLLYNETVREKEQEKTVSLPASHLTSSNFLAVRWKMLLPLVPFSPRLGRAPRLLLTPPGVRVASMSAEGRQGCLPATRHVAVDAKRWNSPELLLLAPYDGCFVRPW